MHLGKSIYQHFKEHHIIHFLDESIDIIKEKFPDYYPYAHIALSKTWANFCNIFIMKKDDFIEWGEFVYGVIFELDRRYNLTSDDDIKNLITEEMKKYKVKYTIEYQSRLEGFIIERLSIIFYDKQFTKKHEMNYGGL